MKSLSTKLSAVFGAITVLAVIVTVTVCCVMFSGMSDAGTRYACDTAKAAFVFELGRQGITDGAAVTEEQTGVLTALADKLGCNFELYSADGETTMSTYDINTKLAPSQEILAGLTADGYYTNVRPGGQNTLLCYVPLSSGAALTAMPVETGKDLSGVIGLALFIGFVLAIGGSVFAAFYMKRCFTDRLKVIRRRAEKLAGGDLSIDFDTEQKAHTFVRADEISAVELSLNNSTVFLNEYIGDITRVLTAISEGDLTVKTSSEYRGDFANIRKALDTITLTLRDTIVSISEVTDKLGESAAAAENSAESLDDGIGEQTKTIKELSSLVAGNSVRVEKNAEFAKTASLQVERSRDSISGTTEEMTAMLGAIREITDSSVKIADIIRTIDDIAFRTNILALNASVEAARAGDAGKGFAVVAEEVRNLAAKSSEAAGSTNELIAASDKAVENGIAIAKQTAESIEVIKKDSGKTISCFNEIYEATRAQVEAFGKINSGIDRINGTVRSSSAASGRSAEISKSLTVEAERLKKLVGSFKLEEEPEVTEE